MAPWPASNSKATAQMPIHTVRTDKEEYIRVLSSNDAAWRGSIAGSVGIVTAYTTEHSKYENLVFVTIRDNDCVFNIIDIEYITKKEYFKEILGG